MGYLLEKKASSKEVLDRSCAQRTYLLRFLLLASIYFLLAELWSLLPLVHLAPISLAAGFSVWGLAVWGKNLWPAVFVGALGSNLLHQLMGAGWGLTPEAVAVISITSVGATLQALLACYWLRDFAFSKGQMRSVGDVLFRLFLIGPVACLISATLGIGSMYLFQDSSFKVLACSWLDVWVSGSIGVLLVAPFFLFPTSVVGRWRRFFWQVGFIPIVIAVIIAISINLAAKVEQTQHTLKIQAASDELYEPLRSYLLKQFQAINSLSDYYRAQTNVSQQEFSLFTQRVIREGYVRGLAWFPRVSQKLRTEFEKKHFVTVMEKNVHGSLIPAVERSEYYPFTFISLLDKSFSATGLDLGSDRDCFVGLMNAAEMGQMLLEERDAFYNDESDRRDDWRLFAPIYQSGLDLENSAPHQRLSALRGFAGVLIYFEDIYKIIDELANQQGLMYRLSLQQGLDSSVVLRDTRIVTDRERPADWVEYSEPVGSNHFVLESWGESPWLPVQSPVLMLGMLVSVVAMLGTTTFIIIAAGQTIRIKNQVNERTFELEQARQLAEEANRAKSDFLASMSHEIRTPLNGVIGIIDVLIQTGMKSNAEELLELIRISSFSLLKVVDDILDFSKIEAGKLAIDNQRMSVREEVEVCCDTLDQFAKRKGVELTLYTDPRLPTMVIGDSLRIRQVLMNLISNAIKFSSHQPSGSVAVRALLKKSLNPDDLIVEFQVRDNGIGMDEEQQQKLFQPFSQAEISTTRRFGGSGLGLAISQNLVSMMKGQISVKSVLGKGSLFKVVIPFQEAHNDIEEIAEDNTINGLSCLMIGDSGLKRDLMNYLKFAGADVVGAKDLSAARQMNHHFLSGPYLWIVDINNSDCLEALPLIINAWGQQRIKLLTIESGGRKKPRLISDDHVMIDRNVLKQRAFLQAVALAAGRLPWTAIDSPEKAEKLVVDTPRARTDKTILVAEDNSVNQKVVQYQLSLLGYNVKIASNGVEAFKLWQKGDYALLLTDLHMPLMDGYQLTSNIRAEQQRDKPFTIIALTANALKGEDEHCKAAGMDDYLSKPVQLTVLKAMLEKWLPCENADTTPEDIDDGDTYGATSASSASSVDLDVLKRLVGNDEALIKELLHEYYRTTQQYLLKLNHAFVTVDFKVLRETAHTLKSSSLSVGALTLGHLCSEIETAAIAKDATSVDRYRLKTIKEVKLVLAFVKTHIDDNWSL